MAYLPPWENIIETKKCRLSGQKFFITDKDLEFYDKISPVFGGKKYSIPSPTLCPDERQKRRLSFRNERKLYKRKCDKTGTEIISIYSPEKPCVVYEQKAWWNDNWSPMDYGRNFDFGKGFFEQFKELQIVTPKMNLHLGVNLENSSYMNHGWNNKNCYLCFNTNYCEDAYYNTAIWNCKNLIDCLKTYESELCYYCIDCYECYNTMYSQDCSNCRDSFFLKNCIGCDSCFMCTNQVRSQYKIYNKQYSKSDYKKTIENLFSKTHISTLMDDFQKLKSQSFEISSKNIATENVVWNYLKNSQDCFACFDLFDGQWLRYCDSLMKANDCTDMSYFGTGASNDYECSSSGYNFSRNAFCANSWENISDCYYSTHCINSVSSVFGCSSLKNAHHCILNTAYSVQEYETLCGKIIDHMRSTHEWLEFFPHELSPFGYNETVADEYFPMTESDVRVKGWNWYDGENKNMYIWTHYVPLPISLYDERVVWYDTAKKNIDEVLAWIIECEITKKPFKIIKQELVFYIENSIPIPTKHPDQRHKERMDLRNPRKLCERTCAECQKEIITTYTPDKTEKVICEECYRKLVY